MDSLIFDVFSKIRIVLFLLKFSQYLILDKNKIFGEELKQENHIILCISLSIFLFNLQKAI